ncbi:hypothetical protein AC230_05175 [Streptomyces caatingaensis]|uniref:SnoaL-like domain-containing protein n=1 Tax=Streptomyces caatingaensis TaxID=1678637 RepID=A0A0K9XLH3_9ACTN|nr:hypothetical protein AC230_05175 [Streptomyces caatingaensis]
MTAGREAASGCTPGWRSSVVNKIGFGEPDEPGAAFEVEQIWFFTVADGRISEIRAVSDRLGMFLQLGWDWPVAG